MNDPDAKVTQVSLTFLILTSLFIACLLISNIVTGRLIDLKGYTITADLFLFPITYIFGDVITEVYGFKKVRITIWLGFTANLLMTFFCMLAIALPYPSYFQNYEAYNAVLGFTPRVVSASLIAYCIGEFTNSVIISKMKVLTEGRWLWTRTITSTIVGQGLDTIIFMTIAFGGIYPASVFLGMMLVQYWWKVGYEILVTPLTYILIGWLKKKEGQDVFDDGVRYNPFV